MSEKPNAPEQSTPLGSAAPDLAQMERVLKLRQVFDNLDSHGAAGDVSQFISDNGCLTKNSRVRL
jgi:hypothetical protein